MPRTWTPPDWASTDVNLWTLGVSVTVRCWAEGPESRAELAADVHRAWSAALSEAVAPGVILDVVVTADDALRSAASLAGCIAAATTPDALHHLSTRVTLAAIERQAGRLWMLHGAALADPSSGATVALVAPSGTGKSTASRTLGTRFGYVSDETVAVAPDLRIHPHPKPLSLVRPGTEIKEQIGPAEVGLVAAPDSPTLAAVMVLRRDGTRQVGLDRLRTSMALAALAPETSYLGRLPRPLSFMAEIVEQTGGVFEVRYEESADLEPVVAELVSR
ncbi:hypothetical protein [Nocardioides sp. AN3]